ncbi:MAG: phosphate acyltransferase PlsX [Peptococcaceae bacterium]|nr:phosphate acyltransferase PlsX [Peptococcaceae bacterium]
MKIAVDAMGGDNAPEAIVSGSLQAVQRWPDLEIILVGDPKKIQGCLEKIPGGNSGNSATVSGSDLSQKITIEEASELITMDEHPANAVRKKKNASIVVATRMVKDGRADALVSAGSTGAQMAAALLGLGRISGIDRPAICSVLPAPSGAKVLLDVGANLDAKPENLCQFALMGSIYAQMILKIEQPRVALLNIGSEEGKGNQLTQQAYDLMKSVPINFTGNIEGRDLMYDQADVIVCDAFVGNIVLKTLEGFSAYLFGLLKETLSATFTRKIGAAMVMPALKHMKASFDYTDYGGAPLLGVAGTSIICHGSSNAKAIMNAIRVAGECVEDGVIDDIERCLSHFAIKRS